MSDTNNDAVQHGIDDNPNEDPKKGLELGALGGGAVGAIAGAALGPVGMIVGALIGGSVGSVASGAAVAAVDTVDNDNTVSGIGDGVTTKDDLTSSGYAGTPSTPDVHAGATASGDYERGSYVGGSDVSATGTDVGGHNVVTGDAATSETGNTGLGAGAIAGGLLGAAAGGPVGAVIGGTLGSLAGGVAGDASEAANDSMGMPRGGKVMNNLDMGNDTPGIQTGGATTAGADTRGITEKVADTVTGDSRDDKTGGMVGGTDRYAQLTSGDYATRPYGTYEGRSISRTDYNALPETDRTRVQLVEEELHVDKEMRQIGEVEISKRVVSEQVQVPVTLEREEIIIHRRDLSGSGTAGTISADETIVVPISEEFANVTKTAHVTGEVEIEKRVTTEQKTISDTVRREELDINQGTTGRVRVEDDTTKNV